MSCWGGSGPSNYAMGGPAILMRGRRTVLRASQDVSLSTVVEIVAQSGTKTRVRQYPQWRR